MKTIINVSALDTLKNIFGTPVVVREPKTYKYTFEVSFESGITKTYSMVAETEGEARQDLNEDLSHRFESYLGKRTCRLVSVA